MGSLNSNEWKQYWLNRWAQHNTRWHQDEFEPLLVKHFPDLPPTTVLVPLCGKTKDMLFLAARGHQVVGVELSELACHAFFDENKLAYQVTEADEFKVFASDRIRIFCGDLFKLNAKLVPEVTAVYDRAALIALPEELRAQYADHLVNLLKGKKNALIFLIAIDYSSDQKNGPPFAVSGAEIRKLYSPWFEVNELSSDADMLQLKPNDPGTNTRVVESVYLVLNRHLDQLTQVNLDNGHTE